MIDKADETPVTIEDCTEVSYGIGPTDVEDPIAGTYNLEVSTPVLTVLDPVVDFEVCST